MSAKKTLKKDFDREQMYRKIMPSLQAAGGPGGDKPEPPVPNDPNRPVNAMEWVLLEMMDQPMKILRCCDCKRCRGDILALALSQLPARYYLASRETLQEKTAELRAEYEVKAKSALIQAIQQVKANPRHEG